MAADATIPSPELAELPPSRRFEASEALTDAFMDDPVFGFLQPDETKRRRWIRVIMRENLRLLLKIGKVFYLGDGDEMGVLGVAGPGGYPPPAGAAIGQMFRMLGAHLAVRTPFRTSWRALKTLRTMEKVHIHESHWYVSIIGVTPKAQGRGYGRTLLNHVSGLADDDAVVCYLETGKEANVGYYQRFGYEVQEVLATAAGGPPMWTMLRPLSTPPG